MCLQAMYGSTGDTKPGAGHPVDPQVIKSLRLFGKSFDPPSVCPFKTGVTFHPSYPPNDCLFPKNYITRHTLLGEPHEQVRGVLAVHQGGEHQFLRAVQGHRDHPHMYVGEGGDEFNSEICPSRRPEEKAGGEHGRSEGEGERQVQPSRPPRHLVDL